MPEILDHFKTRYPKSWKAYEQLRDTCDAEGPLDRKTVELIKIGISTALEHKGGVVAHISQAHKVGATDNEINHAILVAMGLVGFPTVLAVSETAREYLKP